MDTMNEERMVLRADMSEESVGLGGLLRDRGLSVFHVPTTDEEPELETALLTIRGFWNIIRYVAGVTE